jgi:hypothetical protein
MNKLFFLSLFISVSALSQEAYPSTDFRTPLDIPMVLSGTFGELRSDHFHSGLDIKTQKREGLKVMSIGNGYVSRIKISHWGFGKALYITHPNGFTSVYAHLQKFSPEIEAFIKAKQYEKKTYEIQTYLGSSDLRVKKGEVIAFSGNTGGSSGPHLHFEIRSSGNSNPINPMFFGMQVEDTKKPVVKNIYAYPISDSSQINQSAKPIQLNLRESVEGSYVSERIYALGKIGFGVSTTDRQDLAYNKNGIYKIETLVNGIPYFNYDFETFSFSESRYINTLIDYQHYKEEYQRVQRLFKTPANKLSIYGKAIENGLIDVKENSSYNIKIKVKDFADNTTTIYIPVTGRKQEILHHKEIKKTPYYLKAKIPNTYKTDKFMVQFPANTFYNDFYLNFSETNDTISIHEPTQAVHKNFTITFDVSNYSDEEKSAMFIASLGNNNRPIYHGTVKKEKSFMTRSKVLGSYFLAKDTLAPSIKALNFEDGKWLSNYKYLKLQVADEITGIRSYEGKINGEWILLEYEPKTNMLSYNFNDKAIVGAKHDLEVIVRDHVGNSTTFISTFYRKK